MQVRTAGGALLKTREGRCSVKRGLRQQRKVTVEEGQRVKEREGGREWGERKITHK